MLSHQVEEGPAAVGGGQLRQAAAERGPGPAVGAAHGLPAARASGSPSNSRVGRCAVIREQEGLPLDPDDHRADLGPVQGGLQGVEGLVGGHLHDAVPAEAFRDGALRHAAAGPGAPGHRRRGQPGGAPLPGQAVEVGVAGRVAAEARCAERGGERGEQDERGQRRVGGELVQIPGAEGLGAAGLFDAVAGQGVEGAVVQGGRGVEHGGERGWSSGRPASSARSAARSVMSQAATVTSDPDARISSASSLGSRASGPLRLTRTMRGRRGGRASGRRAGRCRRCRR